MTVTEQSIIESAKILFIKNGYRGTSMRDIAADAKVNLAMLNYYFGSKEKLFDIIFSEVFDIMSSNVVSALKSSDNTLDAVERFINVYIDGLIKNPAIPSFIFQEVLSNPQRFLSQLQNKEELQNTFLTLIPKLKEDAEKGVIIEVENPYSLFLDIVSLCVFPFIVKPVIETIAEVEDDVYMNIMESRKSEIVKLMHSYLKA